MTAAPESKPDLGDSLDKLYQLRDELRVAWMALLSESVLGRDQNLKCVAESVNGICNRLHDTLAEMQ
ncbi:hypothetical protein ACSBOB_00825 [Mesorhizobium sp. ASY16-5R]|uniref:hypothetical protein n=1 Tax=Mesorhizobium sp. ASY16-5R TaxID=3445772 RepID=UPI003FA0F43A